MPNQISGLAGRDYTVQHVSAGDLRPGQHITDPSIPGNVGEIAHVAPYRDANGRPRVAVTVMPVWHGVEPMLMRLHATDSVRLATTDEINDYWERRRRREVALGLINLAHQIESGELPLGGYIDVCMPVKTLDDVDRCASVLGVKPLITDGWRTAHMYWGDLAIHIQGPREDASADEPNEPSGSEQ